MLVLAGIGRWRCQDELSVTAEAKLVIVRWRGRSWHMWPEWSLCSLGSCRVALPLSSAADLTTVFVAGATRNRPMVSRYGKGASFARHCDNHCERGNGPLCNGRWLTAVFYCNDWSVGSGGVLRIFQPQTAMQEEQTMLRLQYLYKILESFHESCVA